MSEKERPEVIVHHLEQAKAVLGVAAELGIDVQLVSAPGAAASAGVGYLHDLGEAAGHEMRIDCGEDAGLAMAALRTGCKTLTFSGGDDVRRRLSQMAKRAGATLDAPTARSAHRLVLSPDDDVEQARAWLLDQRAASCRR